MLDGFMYAIGGWDGNVRLDSVEFYNIETNIWTMVPPMKMALTSPACVSLNGMLYVTGLSLEIQIWSKPLFCQEDRTDEYSSYLIWDKFSQKVRQIDQIFTFQGVIQGNDLPI